ncbi:hypothetical protein I308_101304 [Cryptococcus tetragattii IND107]|uniref:Uncharacterized protein n=1 Tax=Cryptococcus tetragattii IND107 TaxID=1296105 RepID=A0ABR3C2D6_9TREE
MGILAVLSFTQGLATFSQVLLGLPAALSLLGPSSFLLLSLLFTLHHLLYSTLRLCLKNTPLAPLVSIVAVLSPAISAALALLTLYFYLAPPPPGASLAHCLVNILPFAYAQILRWVSPLFTLLEGISTLLVIQVAGRVGKGWADEEDKDDGLEWRSVVALVAAALVYCAGLAGIIKTFPSLPFPAFLLGAALTAVLFLSLIGFSLKRTNVLETSLVFVYVVYSAWLSGVEAEMPSTTTIVPVLRRASMGWDDRDEREGFWDGRTLGDEPPNMRITTVFLSYRRAILIAVYTHLLLLDGGSQTWWRWVNIALLLSVWSLELLLDAEGDDTDSVSRWKVD